MMGATDITFYAAVALYAAAAAVAAAYLRRPEDRILNSAFLLTLGGSILLLVTFGLRISTWHRLPLTTVTDSLNLFVLLSTAVMVIVARQERMASLLSFYLPPVALIAVLNALVAHRYLHDEPRELRGIFLSVHVGLAFLAYAMFFVASVTSVAYVFQANRLKHRQTLGLFQKLPSLERLDHVLFRLIQFGYPLFAITMVLGFFWAYVDRELLGAHWYLAPKIVLAVVMASFYSLAFHSRRLGRLRGPKLAFFVCIGFTSLLAVYLVLGLTQLNNYRFWSMRS
jgi:HemX protein